MEVSPLNQSEDYGIRTRSSWEAKPAMTKSLDYTGGSNTLTNLVTDSGTDWTNFLGAGGYGGSGGAMGSTSVYMSASELMK